MNYLTKFLVTTFLYVNVAANIRHSLGPLVLSRPSQSSKGFTPPLSGQWLHGTRGHDLSLHYRHGVPTFLGTQSLASNIWHQLFNTAGQHQASKRVGTDGLLKFFEAEGSYKASGTSDNKLDIFSVQQEQPKPPGTQKVTSNNATNSPAGTKSHGLLKVLETEGSYEASGTSDNKLDIFSVQQEQPKPSGAQNVTSNNATNSPAGTKSHNLEFALQTQRENSGDFGTVSPEQEIEVTDPSDLNQTFVTYGYEGTPAIDTIDGVNNLESTVELPEQKVEAEEYISPEPERTENTEVTLSPTDIKESSKPITDSEILVDNINSSINLVEQVQIQNQSLDKQTPLEASESLDFNQDVLLLDMTEKTNQIERTGLPELAINDDVDYKLSRAGFPELVINNDVDYTLSTRTSKVQIPVKQIQGNEVKDLGYDYEYDDPDFLLLSIIPGKVIKSEEQIPIIQRNGRQGFAYRNKNDHDDDRYWYPVTQVLPYFGAQGDDEFNLKNWFENSITSTINAPDLSWNQALGLLFTTSGHIDSKLNKFYAKTSTQNEPSFLKQQEEWISNPRNGYSEELDLVAVPLVRFGESQEFLSGLGKRLQHQDLPSIRATFNEDRELTPSKVFQIFLPNNQKLPNNVNVYIPQSLEGEVEVRLGDSGTHFNQNEEGTQDLIHVFGSLYLQTNQEAQVRNSNPILNSKDDFCPQNLLNDVFSHPWVRSIKRMILEFEDEPYYLQDLTEPIFTPDVDARAQVSPDIEESVNYLLQLLTNVRTVQEDLGSNASPLHIEQLQSKVLVPDIRISGAPSFNFHTQSDSYNDFTRSNLPFLGLFDIKGPNNWEKEISDTKATENTLLEFANIVIVDDTGLNKPVVTNLGLGDPDFVSLRMDVYNPSKDLYYLDFLQRENTNLKEITNKVGFRSTDNENEFSHNKRKRRLANIEKNILPGFPIKIELFQCKQNVAENIEPSQERKNIDRVNQYPKYHKLFPNLHQMRRENTQLGTVKSQSIGSVTTETKLSQNVSNLESARSGSIDPKNSVYVIERQSKGTENLGTKGDVRIKRDKTDGVTLDLPGGLSVKLGVLGKLFQNKNVEVKKTQKQLNIISKKDDNYNRPIENVEEQTVTPDLQAVTILSEGTDNLEVISHNDTDNNTNEYVSSNIDSVNATQFSVNDVDLDSTGNETINSNDQTSKDVENSLQNSRIKRNPAQDELLGLPNSYSTNFGLSQNTHTSRKNKIISSSDSMTNVNIEKVSDSLHLEHAVDDTFNSIENAGNADKRRMIYKNKAMSNESKQEQTVTETSQNIGNTSITAIDHNATREHKANSTQPLESKKIAAQNSELVHASGDVVTINTTQTSFKSDSKSAGANSDATDTMATVITELASSPMEPSATVDPPSIHELNGDLDSAELKGHNDKPHERSRRDKYGYDYFAVQNVDKLESYEQLFQPGYNVHYRHSAAQTSSNNALPQIAETPYLNQHSNVYRNEPNYHQNQRRPKRFLPLLKTQISVASDSQSAANVDSSLRFGKNLGVHSNSQSQFSKGLQFGIGTKKSLSLNKRRFRRDCSTCQQGSNDENNGIYNAEGDYGDSIEILDLTEDLILGPSDIVVEQVESGLLDIFGNYLENSLEISVEEFGGAKEKKTLFNAKTDIASTQQVKDSKEQNEIQPKRNVQSESVVKELNSEGFKKDAGNEEHNMLYEERTADVHQNLSVSVEHENLVEVSGENEDYEIAIGSHSKIDVKEGRSGNITIEITHSTGLNSDGETKQPTENLEILNLSETLEVPGPYPQTEAMEQQDVIEAQEDSDNVPQHENVDTAVEETSPNVLDNEQPPDETVILVIDEGALSNQHTIKEIPADRGHEIEIIHQTARSVEQIPKEAELTARHLKITGEGKINHQSVKLPGDLSKDNVSPFSQIIGRTDIKVPHRINTLALVKPKLDLTLNGRGRAGLDYRKKYSSLPKVKKDQRLFGLPYNFGLLRNPLGLAVRGLVDVGAKNTGFNVELSGRVRNPLSQPLFNLLPKVHVGYDLATRGSRNLGGEYDIGVKGNVLGLSGRFSSNALYPKSKG